jgi:cytochrome P450
MTCDPMGGRPVGDLYDRLFKDTSVQHGLLGELRRDHPVTPVDLPHGGRTWLVTRYRDVRALLADPRLVKDGMINPAGVRATATEAEFRATETHMLGADPPDHARLRRLVAGAFTMRRIEGVRAFVESTTERLLDALPGDRPRDLLAEFAVPLPVAVIAELLGVPDDDRAAFRESTLVMTTGRYSEVPAARSALLGYIRELIAWKRRHRDAGLLSSLIGAYDEGGDRLSEDELTSTVILLLVAGHDTTVNLIGNGVLHLLTDRERWTALARRPKTAAATVEEILRLESPLLNATHRISTEDITIDDRMIPAGSRFLLSLLAANRDEADGASAASHVAFGHGIHFCLGAPLARLEGQVALAALTARYPRAELAVGFVPHWRPGILMHGLRSLPVITEP